MGKGTFNCVKWFLTIFNFIFLVCGLAICGLSVWMLVSQNSINDMIGKNVAPFISYILLGIGGSIILISFCGCVGAGLENRCLICLFFTLLSFIFLSCLITSILVAIFKNKVEEMTKDRLLENLENNYGVDDVWTQFWDYVQVQLSCCGVKGPDPHLAYGNTKWSAVNKDRKVPDTCCLVRGESREIIDIVQCRSGSKTHINAAGCMGMAISVVAEWATVVIVLLTLVTVALVGGMVLALVHLRNIRYSGTYAHYSQSL